MFPIRLKALRKERNLTQKDLAEKLNMQNTAISKYELGEREPDQETLIKLSEFFNVSTDYLLGKTEHRLKLSEKDEKDIAKTMEKMKKQLSEGQDLLFNGEILDEETAKLLLDAIEQQERVIKAINKKYIPKKYRKD